MKNRYEQLTISVVKAVPRAASLGTYVLVCVTPENDYGYFIEMSVGRGRSDLYASDAHKGFDELCSDYSLQSEQTLAWLASGVVEVLDGIKAAAVMRSA